MMKHWRLSAQDWEQGKDCPLLAFLFDIVMEAIAMAIGKDNNGKKERYTDCKGRNTPIPIQLTRSSCRF